MKKVIVLAIVMVVSSNNVFSQDHKQAIATRNAQRMKDSLGLNQQQYNKIFFVNMQLANDQQSIMKAGIPKDSIQVRLQRVENTRDSLYKPHLSAAQFLIYKQKKRFLIRN